MKVWVSGYGGDGSPTIRYGSVSGQSFRQEWEAKAEASSYLAIWKDLMFTVCEWEDKGAVKLYAKSSDGYRLCDTMTIPGGLLCYISYLPKTNVLLGSCYGSGDFFSCKVDPAQKTFGPFLTYEKQGLGEEREAGKTRAHCLLSNQDETMAFSANIALDRIYLYSLLDGKLMDDGYVQLPKGVGPRHISWREDLHKMYVITEYSNEILLIDTSKKPFSYLKSYSTLQDDFSETSYGSTLVFSKDGRFLYGGNRGDDSIAVFEVYGNGSLGKPRRFSCGGCWPRDLSLMEDGRYLAVANQKSDTIQFLPRDLKTGALEPSAFSIPLTGASFVKEVL